MNCLLLQRSQLFVSCQLLTKVLYKVTLRHTKLYTLIIIYNYGLYSLQLYLYYDTVHYCGRKVAGSIPDGVNAIIHLHNPSGRTMALGSTQPLT